MLICVADSDGERVDRGAAAEQVSAVQTASNESVETDNRMIRAQQSSTDPVGNISLRRTETGRRFFRLARAGESTQSGSREIWQSLYTGQQRL